MFRSAHTKWGSHRHLHCTRTAVTPFCTTGLLLLLLLQVVNSCVIKLALLSTQEVRQADALLVCSSDMRLHCWCAAGVLLQVANYCVTKLAELNVPLCTHKVELTHAW
jgi:hypothetical protein